MALGGVKPVGAAVPDLTVETGRATPFGNSQCWQGEVVKSKIPMAPLPGFLEAMKAKLVDSIRPGDWIYEIKFDGYRVLALRGSDETRVMFRNKKIELTAKTGQMQEC